MPSKAVQQSHQPPPAVSITPNYPSFGNVYARKILNFILFRDNLASASVAGPYSYAKLHSKSSRDSDDSASCESVDYYSNNQSPAASSSNSDDRQQAENSYVSHFFSNFISPILRCHFNKISFGFAQTQSQTSIESTKSNSTEYAKCVQCWTCTIGRSGDHL